MLGSYDLGGHATTALGPTRLVRQRLSDEHKSRALGSASWTAPSASASHSRGLALDEHWAGACRVKRTLAPGILSLARLSMSFRISAKREERILPALEAAGDRWLRRRFWRIQRSRRAASGQAGDQAGGAGGLRATPQNSSTSAGGSPSGLGSGRQREHDTTPGASRSSPSKNRAICSGLRSVIDGVPTRFQCATASSMAAPWTALVEWLMTTKLPGASAATSRLTIEYASSVPGMWCPMHQQHEPGGLGEVEGPRRLGEDPVRVTQVPVT